MELGPVSGSAAQRRATGRQAARLAGQGSPLHRTRMPRDKRDPAACKPSAYEGAGSEAINAMVARVALAILELLADGVPRSKPAIVEALAGRHARDDVVHTLIRLAVTGQVDEAGGKYRLAPEP